MISLDDLWTEHKTRLRRYLLKQVRDSSVVDDLLQDVFLKAHVSLHTLKSPGRVSAWLYRIAANAVMDHYRTKRPWQALPDGLAAPEPEHDAGQELALCLHPLIEDLPPLYRSALLLSEIEGLPQQEVARRLGLSVSGAKSRIQRGREKLRHRLLECCEIERGQGGITDYTQRPGHCGGCDG